MCVNSHKINKILTRSITTLLLLTALTVSAFGASVRGKLQNSQQQPKAYVAVTLYSAKTGRSAEVYTGEDGMYYLNNVPAGEYLLEVWVNPKSPLTYKVTILDPGTDIPPIEVR